MPRLTEQQSLSQLRKIIPNYWYTTAQINDVGQAWASESNNRLFVPAQSEQNEGSYKIIEDLTNKTGLTKAHLKRIKSVPFYIMLPLNRNQNHWTSIAIRINETPPNPIHVEIAFSDSLGNGTIPPTIRTEMQRIANLFRATNQPVTIEMSAYKEAWRQRDGSSCGPYALANAARFLAGRGREDNPGAEQLRKSQLNQMQDPTAFKGCSTNNLVDEVLTHWIINCLSEKGSYAISTPSDIDKICESYAVFTSKKLGEIKQIFIDEFGYSCSRENIVRHLPIERRLTELLQQDEMLKSARSYKQMTMDTQTHHNFVEVRKQQINQLKKLNILKAIEDIRTTIKDLYHDEIYAYQFVADLITPIIRVNDQEIEQKLAPIKNTQTRDQILTHIGHLSGARSLISEYEPKLITLKQAYSDIAQATSEIQSINDPLNLPKSQLQAQIGLLQSAIKRNDASFLRNIAYIINDFCSSIMSIITFGRWEPDYKRIAKIEERIKLNSNTSTLSKHELMLEHHNLKQLAESKALLSNQDLAIVPHQSS